MTPSEPSHVLECSRRRFVRTTLAAGALGTIAPGALAQAMNAPAAKAEALATELYWYLADWQKKGVCLIR